MYNKLSQLRVETDRLFIRPVIQSDLQAFYDMHTVDEVNIYLPYSTWVTWDDAEQWFAKVQNRRELKESEQYVLERKQDSKVVGSCIVFNFIETEQSVEFGYVLNRQAWGLGYMQEAIIGLMASLKKHAEVHQMRAQVELNNQASLSLLNKLGFKKIGEKLEEENKRLATFTRALS